MKACDAYTYQRARNAQKHMYARRKVSSDGRSHGLWEARNQTRNHPTPSSIVFCGFLIIPSLRVDPQTLTLWPTQDECMLILLLYISSSAQRANSRRSLRMSRKAGRDSSMVKGHSGKFGSNRLDSLLKAARPCRPKFPAQTCQRIGRRFSDAMTKPKHINRVAKIVCRQISIGRATVVWRVPRADGVIAECS